MTATGWRKGEIAVLMAGRGTGKSMFMDSTRPPAICILDQADVDGEIWYTVQCKPSLVSSWVQEQDPTLWAWHKDINQRWSAHFNVFDLHEKLYTMMMLKWK